MPDFICIILVMSNFSFKEQNKREKYLREYEQKLINREMVLGIWEKILNNREKELKVIEYEQKIRKQKLLAEEERIKMYEYRVEEFKKVKAEPNDGFDYSKVLKDMEKYN